MSSYTPPHHTVFILLEASLDHNTTDLRRKMSHPGFSVEQDYEYQAYKKLRETYLAQRQADEDASRAARGLPPKRKMSLFAVLSEKLRGRPEKSVRSDVSTVPKWKLEDDSEWDDDEKEC